MATMQPDLEKQMSEIIAAFNAHDAERYFSFSTDDVLIENVAMGMIIHGKEEARANIKNIFATIPDAKIEITSFFATGNHQCAEYIFSGTPTGALPMGIPVTGKSFSVRGVAIAELREGKACRITQYSDSATVMRQLGIFPPPPQK